MSLSYAVPTPLEYFAALVQSDDHFPLLEAAACIALDEYPDLDIQQLLGDVDLLVARLQRRLPADAPALHRLRMLNQYFFADLDFGVNRNDYYHPENSFLNTVLRTRRGIPISLAVLWLEMAQGIGLHVRGVGFPGHFMVKVLLPKGQVILDPLTGQSLSREALAERLEPYQPSVMTSGAGDALLNLYLQAVTPREIIGRMLRNLKEIYASQNDSLSLLAALDRLIVLHPQAWNEWRDRGIAHAVLGNKVLAVRDLETYLMHAENSMDVAAVAQQLSLLRK